MGGPGCSCHVERGQCCCASLVAIADRPPIPSTLFHSEECKPRASSSWSECDKPHLGRTSWIAGVADARKRTKASRADMNSGPPPAKRGRFSSCHAERSMQLEFCHAISQRLRGGGFMGCGQVPRLCLDCTLKLVAL